VISRECWLLVEPILDGALGLPPDDVPPYLDRICAGEPEVRLEVERLLDARREVDHRMRFLDSLAGDMAAHLLAGSKSPSDSTDGLEEGQAVGPYRIVRRLGHGGMGMVYLARDPRLERRVALKFLPRWLALDEAAARRFAEEAKAASALDHPNVETVYEVGVTEDGRRFIAMAYYEGDTLAERIRRGPLPVEEAVQLAVQMAQGLRAAHARGIVHRDIKPANVVVTPEGVAKIVDFGIAKIVGQEFTDPGAIPGTVAYMSPEQTRGSAADCGTDIWSLGVVLYQMLTGGHPFSGHSNQALIHSIQSDTPKAPDRVRPAIPASLARIVERCLAKSPDDRYPSASALIEDLRAVQAPPAPGYPVSRFVMSRGLRPRVVALAAVGVLLLGGLGTLLAGRKGSGGSVTPSASSILVLPFVPAVTDTALAHLGRELVVTLSASLDGVNGIRTADALTVLTKVPEGRPYTQHEGIELARRLGMRSLLQGSLVRSGPRVRLDLRMLDTGDSRSLALVTVTALADDPTSLTDSAALGILRSVWRNGQPPVPSLAAVTTRSVPALRAYLEGERALAGTDYADAVRLFERAFALDSTFWFAYWRSLYPRVYEGSPPDSSVVATVYQHRNELPGPERLLVEAAFASSMSRSLEVHRELVRQYPDYWPGWYSYGNLLVHFACYLGTDYRHAREAMERVVELNPRFLPGWEHLAWIVTFQRDSARLGGVVRTLAAVNASGGHISTGELAAYRHLDWLVRWPGGNGAGRVAAANASILFGAGAPFPLEDAANGLTEFGFPAFQLIVLDTVLTKDPPPEVEAAARLGQGFAWAMRGGLDSALAMLDLWAALPGDPRAPMVVYGLAVTSASPTVTGFEATPFRLAAARSNREAASRSEFAASPEGSAELAWLDGLLAHTQRDRQGLSRAEVRVRQSGSRSASLLAGSLAAFERDLLGDRLSAGRSLAALEWESADSFGFNRYGPDHPWLSSVDRLAASRWLLAGGDTAKAAPLLGWHEAILWTKQGLLEPANRVFGVLAMALQAEIELARGQTDRAANHYRAFLERYDRPPPGQAHLVEEARRSLAAIGRLHRLDPH
jgi:TolB-like protein/tetratricopeptide (TPR) repeat protein